MYIFDVLPGRRPIPKPQSRGNTRYPFETMRLRDSFDVPCSTRDDANRRRHSILVCARRKGVAITTRIADDNTISVWRVG